MDIEQFRMYCLAKKGVTESFPFDEKTLVFKVMGKMFALTGLERFPTEVNLKCNPEKSMILRDDYPDSIYPGYHMNKKHWNTVVLEQIPQDLQQELIDHSYALVVSGLPKKIQKELALL